MRILALSPHPDDIEIGCGASIARFIEEGHDVHVIVFCAAENINGERIDPDIRWREAMGAHLCLSISLGHVETHSFEHRFLDRNKVLRVMLAIPKPDLVFMPCIGDLHQDHETVTKEALRVFKGVSILGYELLWNNLQFKAQSFIKVSKAQLDKKISALAEYKTQANRLYMDRDFIRSLARSRGVQVGVRFAEAFEVIRWVQ